METCHSGELPNSPWVAGLDTAPSVPDPELSLLWGSSVPRPLLCRERLHPVSKAAHQEHAQHSELQGKPARRAREGQRALLLR